MKVHVYASVCNSRVMFVSGVFNAKKHDLFYFKSMLFKYYFSIQEKMLWVRYFKQ